MPTHLEKVILDTDLWQAQHIGERFAHLAFGDGGPFTMEHR